MTLTEIKNNGGYTSIAIDLMDNSNQSLRFPLFSDMPNDQVYGYTLAQLEQSLYTALNWWDWRTNTKTYFNNPTENNVDYLFQNY